MNKVRSQVTEQILDLTLEIIFLLTGEDHMVVKKPFECITYREDSCMPDGLSRSPGRETPPHSLIRERHNEQKILELTHRILRLLTGEVPIRCEDVTVHLSMEEWEYVERHKELYKDLMMEDHQPLSSLVLPSDRRKTTGSSSSDSSGRVTDSKRVPQQSPRDLGSSLCKPRAGLNKTVSTETDRQVSHEKGNPTSTQTKYSFTPRMEEATLHKAGCLTDIYPFTEHTQTEYIFTPAMEVVISGKGDNIIDVDISSTAEHTPTDPLAHVKEESASRDGREVSDADIYPLKEHTQTDYPSARVNRSLGLHEEGKPNPPGIYSSAPMVEHRDVTGQKPKVNRDLVYVRTFNEVDGTSAPPQNTRGVERTYVFSGYNALFSLPTPQGVTNPRTHTAKQSVTCKACGRRFDEEGLLKLHWLTHVGERTFTCSECGEHFPLHAELIKHMKTHRGRKMYPCSDCGKSFNRESHLNLHLRTHTGEKPYTCPECGKSFSQKSHLRRHQSVHTGVKQYGCLECGIHFIRKSDLVRHQTSHAEGEAFICSDCGKCFTHHSDLLLHQRTHTRDRDLLF